MRRERNKEKEGRKEEREKGDVVVKGKARGGERTEEGREELEDGELEFTPLSFFFCFCFFFFFGGGGGGSEKREGEGVGVGKKKERRKKYLIFHHVSCVIILR